MEYIIVMLYYEMHTYVRTQIHDTHTQMNRHTSLNISTVDISSNMDYPGMICKAHQPGTAEQVC